MIPPLNELVGLPAVASPAELGRAGERHFQESFKRASTGDAKAQRDLVTLRVAILNWAYASQRLRRGCGHPNRSGPVGAFG